MAIATVTTLKAPLAETRAFVQYHLRTGVGHMYLFFDDPEDEAVDVLRHRERVTCVRCDGAHAKRLGLAPEARVQERQEANATYALQRAREAGFTWLVHLDSDELLYSRRPLRALFSSTARETEVLLFPVMEAVPQRFRYHRPFQEITLFKPYFGREVGDAPFAMMPLERFRHRLRCQWWRRRKQGATALGCTHAQVIGRYLLGHTLGKSAVRTTAPIARVGNHWPQPAAGRTLTLAVAAKGALLHFDCQGYDRWKAKWISRVTGSANFDTERFASHRLKQLRLFRAAYDQGSEQALEALYRAWYFISSYERAVLKGLGLVRQIHLDPTLFVGSLQRLPGSVRRHMDGTAIP